MKLRNATRTAAALIAVAGLALTTGPVARADSGAAPARAAAGTGPAAAGTERAAAKEVYVWASGVNVRVEPELNAPSPAKVGPETLIGFCQTQGDLVNDPAVGSNNWWTQVEKPGGSDTLWISNLYLEGGQKIEGIPDC
ncbi:MULTISPECIES: peptidase M23 [Streptomyces]|uniref:Peptidase M23 n=1 Tax=Streptomyces lycii TaxID=2654337 RepID=A0ABQ7F9K5_9ACTN|nr:MULTISPECIES: peptidase M23 [Streptomyces]KAF4405122.1 peptidase M23 [Streptomyces lycii]